MRFNVVRIVKIELGLLALLLLVAAGLVVSDPITLGQFVDWVRDVVGPEPVAWVENTFYGIQDAWEQATFRGNTTPGFWTVPAALASLPLSSATPGGNFQPRNVAPLYPKLAAPGEGVWVPIPNAFSAAQPPLMYKTFLHPDPIRPYARIAIVAMDLTRLRLHAVAGTVEPVSTARVARPGLIPPSDLAQLVAGFNGGFKAIHGHYGMMVDGQTILPPQREADTIALYRDGRVRIAPWSVLSDTLPAMLSYRQTPVFLAYQGRVNPILSDERVVTWGAAVSGQTVIWRSALGISADGRTLYYGAGESLTAQRLAEALAAAGAYDVAALDANLAHQQFMMYTLASGRPTEQVLMDQMVHPAGLYVSNPSPRDFFYLTLGK